MCKVRPKGQRFSVLFKSNWISWFKKTSIWSLTYIKAYLSDITVTNISESFTHKMAAKTSWHRYGTKLRHCHHMYTLLRGPAQSALRLGTVLQFPWLCRVRWQGVINRCFIAANTSPVLIVLRCKCTYSVYSLNEHSPSCISQTQQYCICATAKPNIYFRQCAVLPLNLGQLSLASPGVA